MRARVAGRVEEAVELARAAATRRTLLGPCDRPAPGRVTVSRGERPPPTSPRATRPSRPASPGRAPSGRAGTVAPALTDAVDAAFADPATGDHPGGRRRRAAGRVVAERYGGESPRFDRPRRPVTPDARLLSWSMAKSMLHFVVGTLVDEGVLDPDDAALVPEWDGADDPRREIRLADLLAMRDGLAWTENYIGRARATSSRCSSARAATTSPASPPPGRRRAARRALQLLERHQQHRSAASSPTSSALRRRLPRLPRPIGSSARSG